MTKDKIFIIVDGNGEQIEGEEYGSMYKANQAKNHLVSTHPDGEEIQVEEQRIEW